MKKLFILSFLFGFISLSAQTEKEYKEIAEETCECLDTKVVTKDNITANLGTCMFESLGERPKLMAKMDITNQKVMRKFGEKIGTEMVFICPKVFTLLQDKSTTAEKKTNNVSDDLKSVEGKITGFEGTELIFVLLEDNSGRTKKFLWLRSFENDSDLLNQGKAAIGKKVKISYKDVEIYNPSLEEYIKRKEIKAIFF
ncbi:MAG: hypothetical protein ACPG4Y_03175 [Chitinophagales bacterium]